MTRDRPETAMTVTDNILPRQKNRTLPSPPCESMVSERHAATSRWHPASAAAHALYKTYLRKQLVMKRAKVAQNPGRYCMP